MVGEWMGGWGGGGGGVQPQGLVLSRKGRAKQPQGQVTQCGCQEDANKCCVCCNTCQSCQKPTCSSGPSCALAISRNTWSVDLSVGPH
jgi:hypothetical protein